MHNDSNIFKTFIDEIKRIIHLKVCYYRLETLEKGSLFLGYMLLALGCLIFCSFALLCLSFALAYFFEQIFDNKVWGFLIVAAFYLLLIMLLFIFKKPLLINPMIRILQKTLFKQEPKDEEN